jgi:hypothetical protein
MSKPSVLPLCDNSYIIIQKNLNSVYYAAQAVGLYSLRSVQLICFPPVAKGNYLFVLYYYNNIIKLLNGFVNILFVSCF